MRRSLGGSILSFVPVAESRVGKDTIVVVALLNVTSDCAITPLVARLNVLPPLTVVMPFVAPRLPLLLTLNWPLLK